MELLIDPSCSVAFEVEPEEENIMKRKPRKATEPLFGKRALIIAVLQ
jgi:P-type Ca2+ transporter type 2C